MSNLDYLRDAVSPDDRVLDVGSKYGDDMATLNAETIALDIKFKSTDANTEYFLADATRLPFKSNSFDYVFCNQVLEHIKQKRAVLEEIRRVLRSGGEALFTFPNRLSLQAPHSPPGWYSLLPHPIGMRLSSILLDTETAEYYRTSEFMLSPVLARYLMHQTFEEVQYRTLINKVEYEGNTQREGVGGYVQQVINQNARILSRIANIPLIGHAIELFYPAVSYLCRVE